VSFILTLFSKWGCDSKAQSNTISWHVCNLRFNVVVGTLQLQLEVDFKDEKEMVE
jgi:hypothetical protein